MNLFEVTSLPFQEIKNLYRSQTNLKAITDMWTSLNVSSRLEATEAGLAKLSSLVQDVITETTGLQDELKSRPSMAYDMKLFLSYMKLNLMSNVS